MAATGPRPLPLGSTPTGFPPAEKRPERTPRAARLLGTGLLVAVAFAAAFNGAIRVSDGSDLQVGLALLGLGALASLVADRGLRSSSHAGGWAGVALLAAYGAWCALSITWSIASDESWIEANRAWGYALAAGLAVVLGASLARAPEKLAVVYVGLASLVAVYALGGKVAPSLLDHAGEVARLRAPLGYWNALALFCALAVPPALRMAGDLRRGRIRVAALAGLVVLVTTIALTYSRGGLAVTVLGVAVMVALGPDRLRIACLVGIVVLGVVPGLLVTFLREDLTTDGLAASQRADDGLLLLAALAIGLTIAFRLARMVWRAGDSLRLGPPVPALSPRALAGLGALAVMGLLIVIATGWVGSQLDSFTEPRAERVSDPTRIVATNSGNRWVWWKVAAGAAWDEPLAGYGAGSFGLVHRQYREQRLDVRQPHSGPLELLSETGIVGTALAIGGLALLAAAAIRRWRGSSDAERAYAGALMGACAAWAVHAWADWDWDIPAVTLPVLLFLGVLAARPPGSPEPSPARQGPGGGTLVAGGLVLGLFAVSAALPALAREKSNEALALAAKGGTKNLREADERAAAARRLDPFALDPVFTSADLARRRGDAQRAVDMLVRAVRRHPDNPRSWVRLARIQLLLDDSSGALGSARTALALDPLSP
nr:O-antigen ligase family protein [Actinomycetota bacterium]